MVTALALLVEGGRYEEQSGDQPIPGAWSHCVGASRGEIKAIESQWGRPLRKLRRYEKEWLRYSRLRRRASRRQFQCSYRPAHIDPSVTAKSSSSSGIPTMSTPLSAWRFQTRRTYAG